MEEFQETFRLSPGFRPRVFMNRLTITLVFLLLFPLSTFGAQSGSAKTMSDACSSESLPAEIRSILRDQYSSWSIQKSAYLSTRARGRWEEEKPTGCPGIALGRFQDDNTRSYAILLVPVAQPDAGYRFVVFTQNPNGVRFEPKLIEKLDAKGASNYFIHRVAIRKFFDAASSKKYQARMPDGVLLIDSADNEYEADIYFWSNGVYRHQSVDY